MGIDAAFDKSPERIQASVDAAPSAKTYATDGYLGYIDVIYPGKHIRNVSNKNDTYTVEGVNADCGIISLFYDGEADVFQGNSKLCKRFWRFLPRLTVRLEWQR